MALVAGEVVCNARTGARRIADGPVPQIQEKIVEVIKVILRGAVSASPFFFFFSFDSVWEGPWAAREERVLPTAHLHTRGLILSASDGIRNMLFSTYSHTLKRVRSNGFFFSRVCLSCRGSGFCTLFELFASVAQLCCRDDHVHSCQ